VIELRGLEVEAGGFRVGPVDLTVEDGSYAVLLGPSGAGKSLVLEAVAGVRPATAGAVRVAGSDVTGLMPERRRVGLVFQEGLLFPHLTVAKNIAYGLRAAAGDDGHAVPRAAEVERLAEAVGVQDLLARRPATLSGGERQRVALARALAARPRALLLDEPLSAVDQESREALQELLGSVCRERGLPVLHVTHDRDEAFALADACLVLIGGTVRQQGRPLDVLRRPADAAVARFLGARNVLPARRAPHDARVAVLRDGGELGVAAPLPDADVEVVVRPEDVRLSPVGSSGSLTAEVTRLTLQGGHVLVGLEAPTSLEALIPVGDLEAADIRVGHRVAVTVRPADVHVLPAAARQPLVGQPQRGSGVVGCTLGEDAGLRIRGGAV
jgi:ABC-type Fe3+/spermidine/putrescine transport system ATPase subunit